MGFFSWETQDTNRSIANTWSSREPFKVYMVNPVTEEVYEETAYDGYGVFGGKDFYELLAEINGYGSDRNKGINLACSGANVVSPILVEHLKGWEKYKGQAPKTCEYQGYFYFDDENEEDLTHTEDEE